MSGNSDSTGSIVSQTDISASSLVIRGARARQSPESPDEPTVPHPTSTSAETDVLFDEDGSLVEAGELARKTEFEPATTEEWLAAAAPERLAKLEDNLEELPGTKQELLEREIRRLLREAEEEGRSVIPDVTGESVAFEVVEHQVAMDDKVTDVERDDWHPLGEEPTRVDECPKCGAEDVRAWPFTMQTRAADEGETRFTKMDCCDATLRDAD